MNTKLYITLVQAWNFLATVEKNENDLIHREKLIKSTPIDYKIKYWPASLTWHSNKYKYKEMSWGMLLFWIFCCPLFAVLYPFYIYFCNRKYRKAMREHEKAVDNWNKSPEGVKLNQDIQESIEKQQKELVEKKAEYKKYYSDNYYKCLGFLPDWARKIKTVEDVSHRKDYIDGLIRYVKSGAKTLDVAMEYYGKELREKQEILDSIERQKRLEQFQKENIAALEAIARNQEKTNEELERIYLEKYIYKR